MRQTLPASSVTRTLSVVGDSWTLLILLHAFRGARRFGEWFGLLGIPRPVLSDRLTRLARAKIFERVRYQSTPARFEYRLSARGLELWYFTLAIWDWEKRWVRGSAGFAFTLRHLTCGRDVRPVFFCACCNEPVGAGDIVRQPGPGAGTMRLPARRQRRSALTDDETTRLFGDRWTMLLIYAGLRGITRYNAMQSELAVSPHLMSMRLKELVTLGVFSRVCYSKKPTRYEYRLTEKGQDMYKLGVFAMYWGDRWLTPGTPPTIVIHRPCGGRLEPDLRCDHCGGSLLHATCRFEPEYLPRREPSVATS